LDLDEDQDSKYDADQSNPENVDPNRSFLIGNCPNCNLGITNFSLGGQRNIMCDCGLPLYKAHNGRIYFDKKAGDVSFHCSTCRQQHLTSVNCVDVGKYKDNERRRNNKGPPVHVIKDHDKDEKSRSRVRDKRLQGRKQRGTFIYIPERTGQMNLNRNNVSYAKVVDSNQNSIHNAKSEVVSNKQINKETKRVLIRDMGSRKELNYNLIFGGTRDRNPNNDFYAHDQHNGGNWYNLPVDNDMTLLEVLNAINACLLWASKVVGNIFIYKRPNKKICDSAHPYRNYYDRFCEKIESEDFSFFTLPNNLNLPNHNLPQQVVQQYLGNNTGPPALTSTNTLSDLDSFLVNKQIVESRFGKYPSTMIFKPDKVHITLPTYEDLTVDKVGHYYVFPKFDGLKFKSADSEWEVHNVDDYRWPRVDYTHKLTQDGSRTTIQSMHPVAFKMNYLYDEDTNEYIYYKRLIDFGEFEMGIIKRQLLQPPKPIYETIEIVRLQTRFWIVKLILNKISRWNYIRNGILPREDHFIPLEINLVYTKKMLSEIGLMFNPDSNKQDIQGVMRRWVNRINDYDKILDGYATMPILLAYISPVMHRLNTERIRRADAIASELALKTNFLENCIEKVISMKNLIVPLAGLAFNGYMLHLGYNFLNNNIGKFIDYGIGVFDFSAAKVLSLIK
jgi:hypothetical protein